MGCGASKLAGDSFDHIDATRAEKAPRKVKVDEGEPRKTHKSHKTHKTRKSNIRVVGANGFKSEDEKKESMLPNHEANHGHAWRHGSTEPYHEPNESARPNREAFHGHGRRREPYHEPKEGVWPSREAIHGHGRRHEPYHEPGLEPSASVHSPPDYTQTPLGTTTSEDRDLPDPVTGKKPGPYARYMNKRLGVGEPRDPVTGRGLVTGMTKEEVLTNVPHRTAPGVFGYGQAWPFSKKQDEQHLRLSSGGGGMSAAF